MLKKFGSKMQCRGVVALPCFLFALAVLVLIAGNVRRSEWRARSDAAARKPTGHPQFISASPLATQGEMCRWMPAAFSEHPTALPADTPSYREVDRAPVRQIRDTFPTYSAVAVDIQENEVYLQDENLYGFKVFNRLDNTPPAAAFTEPKRVVEGLLTRMEFNCAMYIDQNSGDLYSVNNDMVDTMVVFPRNAQGNVAPKRQLHTPHRTFGIAVDEGSQELYLTVEYPAKVVVYHKSAAGEDKPIRTLEGDQTDLADPHGIAVDPKNQLMFIGNHGNFSTFGVPGSGKFMPPAILVYPLKASGNTPPLRTIEGPDTRLNWPAAFFLDNDRGELYVANDADDSLLVFRVTDSGNAAPTRILKGPKTGLKNPTGVFVDAKNNELWASNMGNHTATVYARTANGNVPPLRTIRSGPPGKLALAIGNPGAVGYDSKRDQILVPN